MPLDGTLYVDAEARDILRRAADLIEEGGLAQDRTRAGKATCVMQALADVGGGRSWLYTCDWPEPAQAAKMLLERYLRRDGRLPRWHSLCQWNDRLVFFPRVRVVRALRAAAGG